MNDENNVNTDAGSGGFDLFDTILKNPEIISKVSSVLSGLNLSGLSGNSQNETTVTAANAQTADNETTETITHESSAGTSDITSRLASIMANKELMAKLPDILSALKPPSGAVPTGAAPAGDITTGIRPFDKHQRDKNIALLLALKPYMSGRRREALEYIIRINKFGDIFKTLT